MKCGYCSFINIDEEHRCARCGRRLRGTAQAAPPHLAQENMRFAVRALGANALAARPAHDAAPTPVPSAAPKAAPTKAERTTAVSLDTARTMDELPRRTLQPSLFGAELQPKIIPFETLPRAYGVSTGAGMAAAAAAPALAPSPAPPQREPEAITNNLRAIGTPTAQPTPASTPKPAAKPAAKKRDGDEAQTTLDFLPPAKPSGRTLKTNAEAAIYCDARVAAPVHRVTAAALDGSMILTAFGMMLGTFVVAAHPAPLNRQALLLTGGLLVLAALLYGLLFAISGTVTPGLRWTNLRLINFDGFAPDWRSRALRLTGCWISALSGGLGLFWALVDEENLTWHDHISKTFPTLKESDSVVVRHRA